MMSGDCSDALTRGGDVKVAAQADADGVTGGNHSSYALASPRWGHWRGPPADWRADARQPTGVGRRGAPIGGCRNRTCHSGSRNRSSSDGEGLASNPSSVGRGSVCSRVRLGRLHSPSHDRGGRRRLNGGRERVQRWRRPLQARAPPSGDPTAGSRATPR
jgi:hypothetical protein